MPRMLSLLASFETCEVVITTDKLEEYFTVERTNDESMHCAWRAMKTLTAAVTAIRTDITVFDVSY